MQRAVEQREQRRFARAVAPDQRDFFAGVDGDAGAVKQHFGAAAQGEVAENDHGADDFMVRYMPLNREFSEFPFGAVRQ